MVVWPEKLAEHFTLKAFLYSKAAEKHGIKNVPPDALLGNALRIGALAEEARRILSAAAGHEVYMHESSGYRCLELNKKVGGAGNKKGEKLSAHCDFRALDFAVSGMDIKTAFDVLRASDLDFDQLILEIDSNGATWIHIQVRKEGGKARRNVLRGVKTPNGSTYSTVQ